MVRGAILQGKTTEESTVRTIESKGFLRSFPLPPGYRASAPITLALRPEKIHLRRAGSEQINLERETGFEPATSTLARSHSTTELLPLVPSFYSTCAFRDNSLHAQFTARAIRAIPAMSTRYRFWHQQRFPTLRCTTPGPHVLWRGRSASSCPCWCDDHCSQASTRRLAGTTSTFFGSAAFEVSGHAMLKGAAVENVNTWRFQNP